MDKIHFEELLENLNCLEQKQGFKEKSIYLFGHCNATEELVSLLLERGYAVQGILDNNRSKQGNFYKGIPIIAPCEILSADGDRTIVCIVARAYAAMAKQLKEIGFTGRIEKLVDYNSFAEYSLSEETILRKEERLERGIEKLLGMQDKYPGAFRVYCPFAALGDVYFAMAYLPYFLEKKKIKNFVVLVIGRACGSVAEMFGVKHVEVLTQKDMDEQLQALLYTGDRNAFIAHQDRPYVVKLYRALSVKMIPLELIYKCGVYGLSLECSPCKPSNLEKYDRLDEIPAGKAVILSPYAKSVTNIPYKHWQEIIRHYAQQGYQVYTNAVGAEEALPGTLRLEVKLSQMQSVVERAGIFIGLRSGLCDVIREADAKKIALYPDCCYSDSKWKMEEIYHLDNWENIVLKE